MWKKPKSSLKCTSQKVFPDIRDFPKLRLNILMLPLDIFKQSPLSIFGQIKVLEKYNYRRV